MAGTGGDDVAAADRNPRRAAGELTRGARLWRVSLTSVWLVYLIEPVSGLFGHHHDALYIGGGLAIIAAFCVVFVVTLADWNATTRRSAIWLARLFALAPGRLRLLRGLGGDLALDLRVGHRRPDDPRQRTALVGARPVTGADLLRHQPDRPRRHGRLPHQPAADGAARAGHDRAPQPLRADPRADRGPRDRGQAGRQPGAAAAGAGHARPDRAVALDDHAQVRARPPAARPAAGQARPGPRPRRDRAGRGGQQADPARHQGGDQRLPAAHAGGGDHHRPRRPRVGRDRAAGRRGSHAAVGHVRPGRRGGAGLVPARGGDQRGAPFGGAHLSDPPRPPRRDADPGGPRRRPRARRRSSRRRRPRHLHRHRAARDVGAAVRGRRQPRAPPGRAARVPPHRHRPPRRRPDAAPRRRRRRHRRRRRAAAPTRATARKGATVAE